MELWFRKKKEKLVYYGVLANNSRVCQMYMYNEYNVLYTEHLE